MHNSALLLRIDFSSFRLCSQLIAHFASIGNAINQENLAKPVSEFIIQAYANQVNNNLRTN